MRNTQDELSRTHDTIEHKPGPLQEGPAPMVGNFKQNKRRSQRQSRTPQGRKQSSGFTGSAKSEIKKENLRNHDKQPKDRRPPKQQVQIPKSNQLNGAFSLREKLNKKSRRCKMKMLKNHPNFDAAKQNQENCKSAKNRCRKHQNIKKIKFFDENKKKCPMKNWKIN